MIILGLVALILGLLLGFGLLAEIGVILIIVGFVLAVVRPGGRRYY